jgi:indole-3-glycerol phosphate synthase
MSYHFPKALGGTILEPIIAAKLREVQAARKKWPPDSIRMALERAPRVRSLKRALVDRPPSIIAELKKASPSAGILRHDFRPFDIAEEYRRGGARALSVLTEREYFKGGLEILAGLRWRSNLPLLRKDFIVDPYQLLEARHAGADAVLLIAGILEDRSMQLLLQQTETLGMEALVEVHGREELDRALAMGATLIGVNNRDLRTFETSISVALDLAHHIPKSVVTVAESGIDSGDDLRRLSGAGYQGFLVGEALMRSESPGASLSQLLASAGE